MSDGPVRRWEGRESAALAGVWGVPEVEAWHRIDSTNDRLLERARDGAPAWTVVVADEQTAGRGRRGAAWMSPPGAGLWMSVLLPPDPAGRPLPLVVGLACAVAVEALAPGVEVGIKWPNDLMLDGRKLGGVLCEAAAGGTVAGVGINVSRAPDVEGATALEAVASRSPARHELAGAVLGSLRTLVAADRPFAHLLPALGDRDVLLGRPVRTEAEGTGVARGIDASGALLLSRGEGEPVRVVAGSVRLSSDTP